MFSVHTTAEKFKNTTFTGNLGFAFGKKSGRKITWLSWPHRFQNFCPHRNAKPAFTHSSGLRSVFKKLRFRYGLVLTVSLTREVNLRILIPPVYCGRAMSRLPCLKFTLFILVVCLALCKYWKKNHKRYFVLTTEKSNQYQSDFYHHFASCFDSETLKKLLYKGI